MKKKKLVLTGADFLLPEDGEHVHYLAPWCFFNNSKFHLWNAKMEQTISSPYQSTDGLIAKISDVMELLPRVFLSLHPFMNRATEQNRSQHYWQALMYSWTLEFVCILYDRYMRLKTAERILANEQSIDVDILVCPAKRPQDYLDFHGKIVNHEFNLSLISQMVSYLRPKNWRCVEHPTFSHQNYNEFVYNARGRHEMPVADLRTKAIRPSVWIKVMMTMVKKIVKSIDPCPEIQFGHITGAEQGVLQRLKWKISRWPLHFGRFQEKIELHLCMPQSAELKFEVNNEFEEFVRRHFTEYIPAGYFSYPKNPLTKRAKFYIGNEVADFPQGTRIAEIKDQGAFWVSPQHGGSYGFFKGMPMGAIEYQFADLFLSWGWNHRHEYKPSRIFPLPSPYLSELKRKIKPLQAVEKIVYVTTSAPAYTYRYDTSALPENRVRYLKNMASFFSKIEPELKEKIWIKTHPHDWLQNELEYFTQIHRQDRIISNCSLSDVYAETRLIINDNLITSFLESLALNIPTILVIDEIINPVVDEAKEYFEELRRVGIYHTDMDEALRFIAQTTKNIEAWWSLEQTQKARAAFCDVFARTDENWKTIWIQFLKNQLVSPVRKKKNFNLEWPSSERQ